MNFDAFLADCRAEWPAFDDEPALSRTLNPRDRGLRAVLDAVEGMATENKLVLLNRAVKHLAPGEVYVEIGCWQGLTLAGAVHMLRDAPVFACDDFSEFGGPRAALLETLARFTAPGQVRFHDVDFRQFLAAAPWAPAPVGVYFYDGGHDFDDQFIALQAMLPHLARDAAILVDDTNWRHVRAANELFAHHVPGFSLVRDLRTTRCTRRRGGTGCSSIAGRGIRARRCRRRPAIMRGAVFWDGAYRPVMRGWWGARAAVGRVPGVRRARRLLARSRQ